MIRKITKNTKVVINGEVIKNEPNDYYIVSPIYMSDDSKMTFKEELKCFFAIIGTIGFLSIVMIYLCN